jgi:hypothetical protein
MPAATSVLAMRFDRLFSCVYVTTRPPSINAALFGVLPDQALTMSGRQRMSDVTFKSAP